MSHINQLGEQDLLRVFEYLTGLDELFLFKIRGRNCGEVTSRVNQVLRLSKDTDNIHAIARLIDSDTETLLFESQFAKAFARAIEKLIRTDGLVLYDVGVIKVDAAMAVDFYQSATFQARDFVYLSFLSLDSLCFEDKDSADSQLNHGEQEFPRSSSEPE
jgi:hypothetical protein